MIAALLILAVTLALGWIMAELMLRDIRRESAMWRQSYLDERVAHIETLERARRLM